LHFIARSQSPELYGELQNHEVEPNESSSFLAIGKRRDCMPRGLEAKPSIRTGTFAGQLAHV
jgi:hypothetical protein